MGDRSDLEPEPTGIGPSPRVSHPGPWCSPHDWPRHTKLRCEDAALLEELYRRALGAGAPAVARSYLEEAGVLLRMNLDRPLSEEWREIFLDLQARLRNCASQRRQTRVVGLHIKECRRSWGSVLARIRRARAALMAPSAAVPPPRAPPSPGRPQRPAPMPPSPRPSGPGKIPKPPKGPASPEPREFDDVLPILGARTVLVVSGTRVSTEIVQWIERQMGAGRVRVAQGKEEHGSAAAFRGEIAAIRARGVHAVLVCHGHMSHSASSAIRQAASTMGIPVAMAERPTKRALMENIRELIGRLP